MLLSEIASRLKLKLTGTDCEIRGVNTLDAADGSQLSFFANAKYKDRLQKTGAAAVIVDEEHAELVKNPLVSSSPYLHFVQAVQLFAKPQDEFQGVSELAYVDSSAQLDKSVCVHPHVYIAGGVNIGAGSRIFAGAYIGENVRIGKNCLIYPRVVLMADTEIGDNVILHPGVVLGSDGFGFAQTVQGSVKFPQIGKVVVEDNVEIGANTAIDRAALGITRIGQGCKIDNLVQVGHNVQVGENSILVAQVGIAGSTVVGKNVILGGQVGVSGHLTLGDGCRVGAKSGIVGSVDEQAIVSGIPAFSHQNWLRSSAVFSRLPEFSKQLKKLEKQVAELSDRLPK